MSVKERLLSSPRPTRQRLRKDDMYSVLRAAHCSNKHNNIKEGKLYLMSQHAGWLLR